MANSSSPSTTRIYSIRRLSDQDLAAKLDQINIERRVLDAELILCLSELERRRLYREFACPSLFDFCVTRLGCSEDVAYKRVGAARMLQQFPAIFELLAHGRIHLTGLMLIKPHLTAANHQDWPRAASGKSKRQIEKLIATRLPQADAPTSIRKLPEPRSQTQSATPPSLAPVQPWAPCASQSVASQSVASQSVASQSVASQSVASQSVASQSVASPHGIAPFGASSSVASPSVASLDVSQSGGSRRGAPQAGAPNVAAAARIVPLSGHSYRIVFTASERLKQKLDRARELLSHAISPNDLPSVIERALDQLIRREEQRRYATHSKPKASQQSLSTEVATLGAEALMAIKQPEVSPGDLRERPERKLSERDASPRETPERELNERDASPRETPERDASPRETPERDASPRETPERDASPRETPKIEDPRGLGSERLGSDRHAPERHLHSPCQRPSSNPNPPQDPDPNPRRSARQLSRYVPAAVRREVFKRDGGQCTFVDQSGRRCEQRRFLEFDHCEAFAIGGSATVDNLRIRCKSHNAREAEKLFGRNRIVSAIAKAKQRRACGNVPEG